MVYIIISLNIWYFPIKTFLQRSLNLYRQILFCLDDRTKFQPSCGSQIFRTAKGLASTNNLDSLSIPSILHLPNKDVGFQIQKFCGNMVYLFFWKSIISPIASIAARMCCSVLKEPILIRTAPPPWAVPSCSCTRGPNEVRCDRQYCIRRPKVCPHCVPLFHRARLGNHYPRNWSQDTN